jgi:hypothetical protein
MSGQGRGRGRGRGRGQGVSRINLSSPSAATRRINFNTPRRERSEIYQLGGHPDHKRPEEKKREEKKQDFFVRPDTPRTPPQRQQAPRTPARQLTPGAENTAAARGQIKKKITKKKRRSLSQLRTPGGTKKKPTYYR